LSLARISLDKTDAAGNNTVCMLILTLRLFHLFWFLSPGI